jgi:hypothetical protein
LMEYKANPSIKNDLGRDVLSYCESFPEIKVAIERVQRETKRAQGGEKTSITTTKETRPTGDTVASTKAFTLQRRLSTATDVKYDMYLINLSTIMKLFGSPSERKNNLHLCHQDLLSKDMLTRFEDLPLNSFVIFVSHQWNGFDHPDPNGVQIECMVTVFRRLRDGNIERVDSDPLHTIIYNENRTTRKKDWMQLLSNAYLFFDFWSQPQPSSERSQDPVRKAKLKHDLNEAIASMGAYVERADCLVVLVPSAAHVDRINPKSGRHEFTCYRTYRTRAFCVMEMMTTYLSRRKTHPMLLVRSSHGVPQWISSLESQKLAVGESTFTCCEKNHKGMFTTCDRNVVSDVLDKIILKKHEYLFEFGNLVSARLTLVQRSWFLRGLPGEEVNQDTKENLVDFRENLHWSSTLDGVWFDRGGTFVSPSIMHFLSFLFFSHVSIYQGFPCLSTQS